MKSAGAGDYNGGPLRLAAMIRKLLGIETTPVSHRERLVSGLGGFAGIMACYLVTRAFIDGAEAALLIASMGASAVLLFAVPHGAMSQPWAVIGGHLVSSLVGVTCAYFLGHNAPAGAVAVGAAITAMYYLRCIHPPGGATALVSVVGGPAVAALGFQFVLTPVMLNAMAILVTAVAFNNLFRWRRYPAVLARKPAGDVYAPIAHEDFVYALSELDSFVDVSEEELISIYRLATQHREAAGKGRAPG